MFRCKSKGRRRRSRIAWEWLEWLEWFGPPFSSCAVAPEIGRPGERSRGKEEHHATAALRSHHHWLDAPPRIFMPQSS